MNAMKKMRKLLAGIVFMLTISMLLTEVSVYAATDVQVQPEVVDVSYEEAETTEVVEAENVITTDSQEMAEQNRKNAVKLDEPTGLHWSWNVYSYSLAFGLKNNPDATNGYELQYLCDGEVVNTGSIGASTTTGNVYSPVSVKIEDCNRSGNYTIRVRCKATKDYSASNWVTLDEVFRYDIPDTAASVPTNVRWNGTKVEWDEIEGVEGYRLRLYCNGKWIFSAWGLTSRKGSYDLAGKMQGDGVYTVEVQSITKDINGKRSSEFIWADGEYIVGQKYIVREFVSRLYRLILNREPDEAGLEAWTSQLIDKTADGAQIVAGFVGSEEFIGRNLSNDEIVEIMYQAMLGRSSDEAGKAAWGKILDNGCSTYYIVNGFAGSEEFGAICEEYGINAGTVEMTNSRDVNADLTGFVTRCYVQSLGRRPDIDGLEGWCEQLLTGADTPKNVAYGFVFSPECVDKNLSDSEYVDMLYRLCMDREADEAGKAGWLNSLKEESREQVFWGFANSLEFESIIAEYGLN